MEKAKSHSVLVVDDEPSILDMLRALLARDGHEILTARNAEEALALFKARAVDIVLSDNVMPGMHGTELLAKLEQEHPDTLRLLMTAEPDTDLLAKAINEGKVFRYIEKPFSPQALKEAIDAAIYQCGLITENRRLLELTEHQNKMLWDLTYELELKVQQRTSEIESQKRMIEESHERLIELTGQRADLLLILAHELNTPLAVIRGFMELLKENNDRWPPAKRVQIMDLVEESLIRLDRNVGSILQALDAGAEKYELRTERFDLRELVRDASRDAQPLIERRRHQFSLDIGPVPLHVDAERALIRNALDNLLLNAIRFTPDGGKIRLWTESGARTACVHVKDTGIGIPEEEQSKIFERFYEVQDPLHHSSGDVEFGSGSLGLGLAVTKSIMERHGGRVRVESKPGAGATFTLELPVAKA